MVNFVKLLMSYGENGFRHVNGNVRNSLLWKSSMKLTPYTFIVDKQHIVPLNELLPLPVPFSMMIDPANRCNFRCSFCPTGNHELLKQIGRPNGCMNYDLYCKIIDDLHHMTKTKADTISRLHLYKDGEPLMNNKLSDMVVYAKKKGISNSIETTTNGSLLNREQSLKLIESGLDVIRISIEHVTNKGYKEITHTFGDYEKIKRNVEFIFNEKKRRNSNLKVYTKIIDFTLSDNDKERFVADFTPISDYVNVDHLMGWSKSNIYDWKLGNVVNTGMHGITNINERIVCPEPFSKLAINVDGTVSICCVDWSHGTVIGDVNTQSLMEIWHGEKLKEFRLLHLKGKRKQIDACSNCDYLKGLPECTILDDSTKRLLQIYTKL